LTTKDPKEALKRAIRCVVTVERKEGHGSGVIISSDGYLVTNYHVVEDEKQVGVTLNQGIKMKAEVVKVNPDFDLALLKIPASDLEGLRLGNSDEAEIGDDVWAIGTPLEKSLGQTITKGIISGFREIRSVKFIQSDVSINPGNSGGPLINEAGDIIGITSMKIEARGIEGIGFCIPSNIVVEMLNLDLQ
jgi:S1-C subfamily serine protease